MSPLKLWTQFFSLEAAHLPLDPLELDEICCDTERRVISHIGIQLGNCFFNSLALREIHRQAAGPKNIEVQIRFNRSSMAHIWVKDPRSGDRIQVPNIDPELARLSAAQVKAAFKFQGEQKKSDGEMIAMGEALKRMREIGESLLRAHTQRKRRQGLKLLGMGFDDPAAAATHPPVTAASIQSKPERLPSKKAATPRPVLKKTKSDAPVQVAEERRVPMSSVTADSTGQDEAALMPPSAVIPLPIFAVTKRPADRLFSGEQNAHLR